MGKPMAWALLVVGIILLAMGFQAYHSIGSGVSRAFTGAPTNRAIWLLVGGALAAVAGAVGLSRSGDNRP